MKNMTDTAELRKLAKAATPGPWHPGHLGRKDHTCQCTSIVNEGYAGGIARVNVWNGIKSIAEGGNDAPPEEEAAANMRFIAAFNPQTAIALLDALTAKDAEIAALKEKVKRQEEALMEIAKPTYGTEISMTGDERAEILGRHLFSKQAIARRALSPVT